MRISLIFVACFTKIYIGTAENQTMGVTLSQSVEELLNEILDSGKKNQLKNRIINVVSKANVISTQSVHEGFRRAMNSMKSTNAECYRAIRVRATSFPSDLAWPKHIWELITEHDYITVSPRQTTEYKIVSRKIKSGNGQNVKKKGKNSNGQNGDDKFIINITYSHDGMYLSYYNWFLQASTPLFVLEIDPFKIKLKENLDAYYEKHKNDTKFNRNYENRTEFYKYFAAVMARSFKLAGLFLDTLDSLLTIENTVVWENPNISFHKLLLTFWPKWYFTVEHLELINIAWKACCIANERRLLKVGYTIKKDDGENLIIPIVEKFIPQEGATISF